MLVYIIIPRCYAQLFFPIVHFEDLNFPSHVELPVYAYVTYSMTHQVYCPTSSRDRLGRTLILFIYLVMILYNSSFIVPFADLSPPRFFYSHFYGGITFKISLYTYIPYIYHLPGIYVTTSCHAPPGVTLNLSVYPYCTSVA